MQSQLLQQLALLRFPLLFNVGVGLILSAVSTSRLENTWYHTSPVTVYLLLAFFSTSFVATSVFIFADRRRGGIKIGQGRHFIPTNIFKAVVDATLAIILLVLHIVNSVVATNYDQDIVLVFYCGFGALSAAAFHAALTVVSLARCFEAWKMGWTQCPTCNGRIRRCDSPLHSPQERIEPVVFHRDRKGSTSAANEEGSSEGDRLIAPSENEV